MTTTTTGSGRRGIFSSYTELEIDAADAAAKHFGLKKTTTPHDLHLQEITHRWMLDPKSPKKTGDYSGWEDEEVAAMEKLVDQLY